MSVRFSAAGTSGGSVPSRLCPPGSDTWTSFLSFFTPFTGSFGPFYLSFESEDAAGLAASVDFESVSDFFSADPCGISSEAEDS